MHHHRRHHRRRHTKISIPLRKLRVWRTTGKARFVLPRRGHSSSDAEEVVRFTVVTAISLSKGPIFGKGKVAPSKNSELLSASTEGDEEAGSLYRVPTLHDFAFGNYWPVCFVERS